MRQRYQVRTFVSALVAITVLAVGIGGASAATATKPASGEPIKLGVIANDSGIISLPEQTEALQAYVDDWNKRGGYKGQPIELIMKSGSSFSAAESQAAAQELLDAGVIGFVGNNGLVDCGTNGPVYQAQKIAVIAPANVTSACYKPDIHFPFRHLDGSGGGAAAFQWAVDQGSKKFGMVTPDYPGKDTIPNAMEAYREQQGIDTTLTVKTVPLAATGADYDQVFADFKGEGVDTVFMLVQSATANVPVEHAVTQGFGPHDIRWIMAPAAYNPKTGEDPTFEGAYALATGPAWEANTPQVKKARKVLEKGDVSLIDGLAMQGYEAGGILESVFKNIKGAPTKESLLAAAKKSTKVKMVTSRVNVNLTDPKNNPEASQIVQFVDGGGFKPASDMIIIKFDKT